MTVSSRSDRLLLARVERGFRAAHAVTIRGVPEVPHEHEWRVRAVVEGTRLDSDGLLCDFHDVERALAGILAPFEGRSLNEVLASPSPSAERVALHVLDRLEATLRLPPGVRVRSVSVTESPGCEATALARSGETGEGR